MKILIVHVSACIIFFLFLFSGCMKTEEPIKYAYGTFPDTIMPLSSLNSQYDDYNTSAYLLQGYLSLVFSSNRESSGEQFDLIQGLVYFIFDQQCGKFEFQAELTNDVFLTTLTNRANTSGDDLGPNRIYSPSDGYEYMILSSANSEGNLDLYYTKNRPYYYGYDVPVIEGPFNVSIFNTDANEAYFCFNISQDSGYFCSDITGDFDIYVYPRSSDLAVDTWLNLNYVQSTGLETINTAANDKCPYVYGNLMVFVSDKPGGFGGYDIYYSVLKNGQWGPPVNMGPGINTEANEYRPVIGGSSDYTNEFMIFSSDRPDGKGGYDLYFTGLSIP